MLILGWDIAARKGSLNCGLALINESFLTSLDEPCNDLVWTKTIDGTDLRTISAVIAEVKAAGAATVDPSRWPSPTGAMLAIERQFPGTFSGAGQASIEKLIEARATVQTVAKIRGVPFETYYPATWQVILKILGKDMPMKLSKPRKPKPVKAKKGQPVPEPVVVKAPRQIRDTKAAARLLVSRLYPGVEMGPDEADALLIARHAGWQRRDRGALMLKRGDTLRAAGGMVDYPTMLGALKLRIYLPESRRFLEQNFEPAYLTDDGEPEWSGDATVIDWAKSALRPTQTQGAW